MPSSTARTSSGNLVFKPLSATKRGERPLVNFAALTASPWYEHGKKAKAATVKTVDQLVSYLEKWAGADLEAIEPDARDLAKYLAAQAIIFKNRRIMEELSKAA